jgi:hypothetical protein
MRGLVNIHKVLEPPMSSHRRDAPLYRSHSCRRQLPPPEERVEPLQQQTERTAAKLMDGRCSAEAGVRLRGMASADRICRCRLER